MSRDTFFLRPRVVAALLAGDEAACPPPRPGAAAHAAAWAAAFPEAGALAPAASRLFPATAPEAFARWLAARSAVTAAEEAAEPVLAPADRARAAIFPIRDAKMWEFRKTIERLHWLPQEVPFDSDRRDFDLLPADDRRLIESTLGFFGAADELVMEGIDEVIAGLLREKEGQFYLRAQADQECAHSEAYSIQIQEFVADPAARQRLFDAVRTKPGVGRMADWVRWWIAAEHPAADVFTAMAFLEGVLFSSFFATIQHYKAGNKFRGMTAFNEFIARDEGVHTLFWCFVVRERLRRRPDPAAVAAIAAATVALSDEFYAEEFPVPVVGLNAALLGEYTRFVADTVLAQLGAPPAYGPAGRENPLKYMVALEFNQVAKTNFFEASVSQYQGIGRADGLRFAINDSPLEDEEQ